MGISRLSVNPSVCCSCFNRMPVYTVRYPCLLCHIYLHPFCRLDCRSGPLAVRPQGFRYEYLCRKTLQKFKLLMPPWRKLFQRKTLELCVVGQSSYHGAPSVWS